mgnify:CR=1 FL=1
MLAVTVFGEEALNELEKEWMEMFNDGSDSVDCYSHIKSKVTENYDGEVYDYVDSQPGRSFESVVEEIVYNVEQRVENHLS